MTQESKMDPGEDANYWRYDDMRSLVDRVTRAVFGTWEFGERHVGVIERLEKIEVMIRYGIAGAGAVGALLGSLATILIQHVWK